MDEDQNDPAIKKVVADAIADGIEDPAQLDAVVADYKKRKAATAPQPEQKLAGVGIQTVSDEDWAKLTPQEKLQGVLRAGGKTVASALGLNLDGQTGDTAINNPATTLGMLAVPAGLSTAAKYGSPIVRTVALHTADVLEHPAVGGGMGAYHGYKTGGIPGMIAEGAAGWFGGSVAAKKLRSMVGGPKENPNAGGSLVPKDFAATVESELEGRLGSTAPVASHTPTTLDDVMAAHLKDKAATGPRAHATTEFTRPNPNAGGALQPHMSDFAADVSARLDKMTPGRAVVDDAGITRATATHLDDMAASPARAGTAPPPTAADHLREALSVDAPARPVNRMRGSAPTAQPSVESSLLSPESLELRARLEGQMRHPGRSATEVGAPNTQPPMRTAQPTPPPSPNAGGRLSTSKTPGFVQQVQKTIDDMRGPAAPMSAEVRPSHPGGDGMRTVDANQNAIRQMKTPEAPPVAPTPTPKPAASPAPVAPKPAAPKADPKTVPATEQPGVGHPTKSKNVSEVKGYSNTDIDVLARRFGKTREEVIREMQGMHAERTERGKATFSGKQMDAQARRAAERDK